MIDYRESPSLDDDTINRLFAVSWKGHTERDFQSILSRSLAYIAAFDGDQLVGFVNVATDGGEHAFLLDTTVHPDFRRCGVGTQLVQRAGQLARQTGATWLHVDFEPGLKDFYFKACGFRSTAAGLIRLS